MEISLVSFDFAGVATCRLPVPLVEMGRVGVEGLLDGAFSIAAMAQIDSGPFKGRCQVRGKETTKRNLRILDDSLLLFDIKVGMHPHFGQASFVFQPLLWLFDTIIRLLASFEPATSFRT